MKRTLLVVLLCASACAKSGPPDFPVGLFGVDTPADADAAKDAGFNAFQSYATSPAQLTALAARGMSMLVSPRDLISSTASVKGWPLAAWYLQDEPDVAGTPPAELAAFEARVRAWSPGTPTAFVVGIGTAAATYAQTGDALMVDWYPVPHLPLQSVGEQVRAVVSVAKGRPVWAVLQSMDWRDFAQHNPKKPRIGRFPDRAEMRFMAYDAVLSGARGIWFFTWRPVPGRTLADRPAEWFAVSDVAREMAAMAPIFARGRLKPLPFENDEDGPTARCWAYHGRDYLVLANARRDVLMKVPSAALEAKWRPLFEARRDPRELLESRFGASYLRPYQILVLESRLQLL
jgi:hypothetical protein